MRSPEDYGAKGDGVTDDTDAIQAFIDDEHVPEMGFYLGDTSVTLIDCVARSSERPTSRRHP